MLLAIFLGMDTLYAQPDDHATALAPYEPGAKVRQGELIFQNESGEAFWAPLLDTEVDIDVSGLTASVVVKQSFSNPSQTWMEGRYQFPLPERSAVHRMIMRIGEREIVGEIKEKQEAKKRYLAAKQAGKRASLVSQQRPNMFTNTVANIGPGETITVEIHYIETVNYDRGEFSLRFPTTFTPRYVPSQQHRHFSRKIRSANIERPNTDKGASDDLTNPNVDPQTGWLRTDLAATSIKMQDHLDVTPVMIAADRLEGQLAAFKLSARIDAGFPLEYVRSPYHQIHKHDVSGIHHVSIDQKIVRMNRDIVLQWKPVFSQAVSGTLFKETLGDEDYHLLMLLPNAASAEFERHPREVIFVIDTSGSMSGVSIRQAKAALQQGLRLLHPGDRFNILNFSNKASKLFPQAVAADARSVAKASAYIDGLRADGGTNISQALMAALGDQRKSSYIRQVVFVTDGSVSNEEALFAQIDRDLGASRLFTVGIGSAPNSYFMREAAEMGRGSFTHIGDINDVSSEISHLFAKLENPVLTHIELDWGNNNDIEMFPKEVPDLYLTEPLVIYIKSGKGSLTGQVTTHGRMLDNPWQQSLSLAYNMKQSGIAKQWARQKIRALMSSRNPATPEEKKQAVTRTALEHQLLSRYTSFVAVETVVARPLEEGLSAKNIPNAMPHGNTMLNLNTVRQGTTLAMPNTATPALMYFILGLMVLVFSLVQALIIRRS
jgi:Ca-activated chloride channel family protein